MRINIILLALALALTSCQSMSSPTSMLKKDVETQEESKSLLHNYGSSGQEIFYSYSFKFADLDKVDVLISSKVRLEYEDGCIYLFDGRQRNLPLLPHGQASWDEDHKTLMYFKVIYEIGDIIEGTGTQLLPWEIEQAKKEGFITTPSNKCKAEGIYKLYNLPYGRSLRNKFPKI